jgi:ribonucleotide reductase alpha subunit
MKYLCVADFAKACGKTPDTVRKTIQNHGFPGMRRVQIGKRHIYLIPANIAYPEFKRGRPFGSSTARDIADKMSENKEGQAHE